VYFVEDSRGVRGHQRLLGGMSVAMRLRTFLQLLTIFLIGTLSGLLILALHLPRPIEQVLGFVVTTITIATMWALRAKAESTDVVSKGSAVSESTKER